MAFFYLLLSRLLQSLDASGTDFLSDTVNGFDLQIDLFAGQGFIIGVGALHKFLRTAATQITDSRHKTS